MKKVNEGLAELAGVAEKDHEVQMARADLYKIAKYAIKLHDMLKGVSETEGLEGWQQAKITKASDYISSVYHNLDYSMKFGEQQLPESDKKKAKKSKSAYTKPVAESNDPYKKKLAERLAKKIS
jgi:predicted RNA-binding protein with EMAP domain